MIPWRFLLFSVFLGTLYLLKILLAHRAWKRAQQFQVSSIDLQYIRRENFFGTSFRQKLQQWLELPVAETQGESVRIIQKGSEKIRISGPLHYDQGTSSDDILVVEGNFSCDSGCTLSRELYVRQDCKIGAGTRLQAVAVEGGLTFGRGVTVERWVDSGGALELGEGCSVWRVFSGSAVLLCPGTKAVSVCGTEISTIGRHDVEETGEEPAPAGALQIPPAEAEEVALREPAASPASFDAKKLNQLSEDCWIYEGDLQLKSALRLKTKLVVKGQFSCAAGSVLEGDVKARGSLHVGPASVCRGNLIADGAISLGAGTHFQGIVHAGKTLRLCWGVRGIGRDGDVVAYSGDSLTIENNVVVRGKLVSDDRILVVS